jgi:hypothetical protein
MISCCCWNLGSIQLHGRSRTSRYGRFAKSPVFHPASNPDWMTHSIAAYAGPMLGPILESVKFISEDLVEKTIGGAPW